MSIINTILSPFVAFIRFIRSLIVFSVRVRGLHAAVLFDLVYADARKWIVRNEWTDSNIPGVYECYARLNGMFLYLSISERELRTGGLAIDNVAIVTLARWNAKKLYNLIVKKISKIDNKIPIYLSRSWGSDKLGVIGIPDSIPQPYIDKTDYEEIDEEMRRVFVDCDKDKTGIILHGAPGNGKSFLVRHFAFKYKIPIHIIAFSSKYENADIITMFGRLDGPAIVLFEDFDNYFDKRKPCVETVFSFDALLNVLDGNFTTYEKVAFFMTANDIEKIDPALRYRPSRFRFAKHICDPDYAMRLEIFGTPEYAEKTEGFSLDAILIIRSEIDNGRNIDEAIYRTREIIIPPEERASIAMIREEEE